MHGKTLEADILFGGAGTSPVRVFVLVIPGIRIVP